MSEDDRLVGTLVADRYRVGRKLGEGGMGLVYMAVHESLRKPVALKVLGTTARLERESIARFEREAIATANLKHPNIAEATDFGQLPDGGLYLVMEYVEGKTLRSVLAEQGKLPPARALSILRQIGAALSTAHARDVVHRDLKPDNVILTTPPESTPSPGGPTELVKVIDFGIAKLRSATFGGGATGLTTSGSVFGTAAYMAPEQVMGQPVDARADQYALGVLAFELLTGKPPFASDDVGQLMMMHVGAPIPSALERTPTLGAGVAAVLTRMLAKLPDERFASVAEAMQALGAAIEEPGVASAPVVASAPAVATEPLFTPNKVLETTLPSPVRADAATPMKGPRRLVVVAAVGAALVLAAVALLVILVARSHAALPPELAAALADWNDGKYEAAGPAIGKAILASPELAEREDVGRPLAAPVGDDAARRALTKLLETTTLGRSHAMASALAGVAVADDPKRRDAALALLRDRHDLLAKEEAARTSLRDAETCEALEAAKASATEVASGATRRDLDRLGAGECKALLRVGRLCDACAGAPARGPGPSRAGPATAAPPPAPPGAHGKGKGKDHK